MTSTEEKSVESGVEEAIARIDELIAEDNLQAANEAIDKANEVYGEVDELFVLRAEVALDGEDYQQCVAAVDDALKRVDDDEIRGQLLELRGYAQFYLDDLEDARGSFNEAIRVGTASWSALLGRAMVHEDLLYFYASMLDLDRAIALDDQEAQPFAIRGSIHLRRGDMEKAEGDLAHAIFIDPDDEESRLSLARLQAVQRKTSAAIETIEPLVEAGQDPEFVLPAALLRSQLSLNLGSTDAAIEDAEKAIEAAPDEPWGYLQLAACYLTAVKPGEAIGALKEAESKVDDIRDIPDVLALRASAYQQLDKPDKAAKMKAEAEGTARLPSIVYGNLLNPARNIPLNPNKPVDVRNLMTQIFDDPSQAPDGYEKALRDVVDRIPEMIEKNPNAGQIRIQLPELEGMESSPQSLVLQVNKGGGAKSQG